MTLSVGVGVPAVVTVKVPALPTGKLVADGLVKRRPGPSPIEPTDTPLPGREREEARQLVQVHAAEDADMRTAARAGPRDQIDPAVAVEIAGRHVHAALKRGVVGEEAGEHAQVRRR